MVGSIVVAGALTHCAWLHSMWDLKATQMIVQRSLICQLMFYEYELGYNTTEAIKNVCCVKTEGTVDRSTVSR